jgi:hypothetical protein
MGEGGGLRDLGSGPVAVLPGGGAAHALHEPERVVGMRQRSVPCRARGHARPARRGDAAGRPQDLQSGVVVALTRLRSPPVRTAAS